MASIQVSPDEMDAKASELKRLKEAHDAAYQGMNAAVSQLSNNVWKGKASSGFIAAYEGYKPSFDSFSRSLEEMAQILAPRLRSVGCCKYYY